ncbi:EAL domain-containing protein [Actimicrobium sp. CCC2.4]|uniref:putative bifunctional diguanylate cyclase/phosphodiesterase n=1 Tax=Actimicrobium sp. CCC2.4 TaxID=3048606 RepID=UPI002AC93BC4|nr:EAL domain-containing protein [Actimicrobium sp. CCC2.4]MEB0133747.1 EAL domain-containing protein [Actimicrobium sp. CCC2.4]WPX31293.1 EAL domain-containing protein [Actimicrobium sp. CCC2.4]
MPTVGLAARLFGAPPVAPAQTLLRRLTGDLQGPRGTSTLAVLAVSLSRSDAVGAMLELPDSMLVNTALLERLTGTLHADDYLALAGPDEVWIVLQALTSPTVASLAATNIARALEAPFQAGTLTVTMRPCIGIAVTAVSPGTALGLLEAASEARKRAGSLNRLYVVATETEGIDLHHKDLIVAVTRALAENRLTMAYQPKVDLATQRVVSVEALIRWPADLVPVISPMVLVEIAERFGMIEALTRHVLHTVLREHATLLAPTGLQRIWINLSAGMLADPGLPEFLQQGLDIWSAGPPLIGLEITESAVIGDIEQSIAMMHALTTRGFELAIDDFGTGYSSLAYLRRFPISELKIDKMFVQHMTSSDTDARLVRTIIDLAHNFKLKVVAEGVEDAATLELLAQMDCDQIQGYVYAKPMPAAELVRWMANFHVGIA